MKMGFQKALTQALDENNRLRIKNESQVFEIQRLKKATGLLNSMILSGEKHSETSVKIVEQALNLPSQSKNGEKKWAKW